MVLGASLVQQQALRQLHPVRCAQIVVGMPWRGEARRVGMQLVFLSRLCHPPQALELHPRWETPRRDAIRQQLQQNAPLR